MSAFLVIPWFQLGTLFEIPTPWGPIPIQAFGLLVATGVLVGARVAEWFAERHGVSPYLVSDMAAHVILVAFVCAYFLNAAFYDPDTFAAVLRDPTLLSERYLGLSSYGGFLGAVLGALIFVWRRGIPFYVAGDAVAFGFPIGWLFGRTGCFVVHDHPGRVSDFFLAVDAYQVPGALPPYPARHDLGLYEVFWSAAVVALFFHLAKTPRKRGTYVALLALTYAPVRFLLDFLRAPPELGGDVRYAGLTPAQWGSLGLLIVGALVAWWLRTHPEVAVPEDARWPPPDEPADGTPTDTAPPEPASAPGAPTNPEEPG